MSAPLCEVGPEEKLLCQPHYVKSAQNKKIKKLILFYQVGSLKLWRKFSINNLLILHFWNVIFVGML